MRLALRKHYAILVLCVLAKTVLQLTLLFSAKGIARCVFLLANVSMWDYGISNSEVTTRKLQHTYFGKLPHFISLPRSSVYLNPTMKC